MRYDSVFDVLGHIIVGPSSSHTAGACRIGYIANQIYGKIPEKVIISLHGSFAETYQGHKTDIAIVGGLLGYTPENEEIPFSFQHARENGMEFLIQTRDFGSNYHPNSVLLEFYEKSEQTETNESDETDENRVFSLIGSSIGGGNVRIIDIDGMEAGFDGDRPTLIEIHHDQHGVLAKIMEVISIMGYNVKEMHLSRNIRTQEALSWMELSKNIDPRLIKMLYKIKPIKKVRWLNV